MNHSKQEYEKPADIYSSQPFPPLGIAPAVDAVCKKAQEPHITPDRWQFAIPILSTISFILKHYS